MAAEEALHLLTAAWLEAPESRAVLAALEVGGRPARFVGGCVRDMLIDRSRFTGNTARLGGVSFIKQNDVVVRATTFSFNRSGLDIDGNDIGGPFGGLWINEGTLDLENSTFADNQPSGLDVDGSGTVNNATFQASRPAGNLTVNNSLFADTDCSDTLSG